MESKKINQLATELAPDLSDLTIIGDPTTGISKKITLSQMASLFTGTVEEYANFAAFPLVGVADTIYVAKDTNVIYRWDSTAYVVLSPNIIASLVFNDANGFDGTISLVGSVATLTITTALTTGSVGFIGASGALLQDNANFFWDDTNNRLGLGTNAPTTALDVFGSGIIGRINGTSTNNAYLGFASAGTNKWSVGNVQSDHRFRIFSEANSAELITVLQTGEFGIGIANPTTKFHIDGAASALIANLDANVSIAKSLSFRSDNSNRINLEVSGTESGSNAGADFFIRRYSDAGSLIDTPLKITRSTGNILIGNITTDSGNVLQVRKDQASPTRLEISNANASGVETLFFTNATEAKGFLEYTNSSNSLALYNVKSGPLVFGTNNVTTLTISSTGAATFTSSINAGSIDTTGNARFTSAGNWMQFETNVLTSLNNDGAHIRSVISTAANPTYTFKGDTDTGMFSDTANTLGFTTGGTNRLTIASTGAATFSNSVTASALFLTTSGSTGAVFTSSGTNVYTSLSFFNTTTNYGYDIGFGGSASIAPNSFYIYGGSTANVKLAITGAGNVLMGTTSVLQSGETLAVLNSGSTAIFGKQTGGSSAWVGKFWNNDGAGNNNLVEFLTESSLTARGSITFNRGATLMMYNTTSDANLKNIIGDSNKEKSIYILNSTKIREYSWKEDKTNKPQIGVIAQELYETYKGAVVKGSEDELLGTEEYVNWSVDKTAFTFHLIAGWQKHQEIIENLESRIKQLEAK
jgi:hypothetical protein